MPSKLSEWSKTVKARDGKCMHCGTENDLHAHHINHKSTHPELTLDVENGVTLCYRCHKAEHETNRPPRIRSTKPNRASLLKKIEHLEKTVESLKNQLHQKQTKNMSQTIRLTKQVNLSKFNP